MYLLIIIGGFAIAFCTARFVPKKFIKHPYKTTLKALIGYILLTIVLSLFIPQSALNYIIQISLLLLLAQLSVIFMEYWKVASVWSNKH